MHTALYGKPAAPLVRGAELPEGRRLVLSLSGTERTDWKLGIAALTVVAFGLGYLFGRKAKRR
jgi:hypothetical protein